MLPKNEDNSCVRGPLNMLCTKFDEDWMKNVPKVVKNVFFKKIKMAEKFSRRKWAWPISVYLVPSKEHTVQRLFEYALRFMSYKPKCKTCNN